MSFVSITDCPTSILAVVTALLDDAAQTIQIGNNFSNSFPIALWVCFISSLDFQVISTLVNYRKKGEQNFSHKRSHFSLKV